MTTSVQDLGLELRGVPQSKLDAAQLLLDTGWYPVGMVRWRLRQHCPDQLLAEEYAKAALRVHHTFGRGEVETECCLGCHAPWPCPDAQTAARTLGMRPWAEVPV